jgi:hypothetical protein
MAYPQERMKDVYTIMKGAEGRKDRWVRIGIGFINRDNSISVRLDASPTNGTLHIREYVRKSDMRAEPLEEERSFAQQPALAEGGLS